MQLNRIKELREAVESESLSYSEIEEIERAFNEIPDDELSDLRENATADDMLNELESRVSELEWIIYDYVIETYGEEEAKDPTWDIKKLAEYVNEQMEQ